MIDKISSKIVTQTKKIIQKAPIGTSKLPPMVAKTLETDVFINSKVDEKFSKFLDRAFDFVQKVKTNKARKTFEKIEFQPAKTIEEALEYSRKLGIQQFDLGENQTLEVLNYLNEGFTRFRNIHLGLAQVPARVCFQPAQKGNLMSANPFFKLFNVNQNVYGISNIDSSIKRQLDDILDYFCDITPDGIDIPPYYSSQVEIDYLKKMIDRYRLNPETFDYGQKVELFTMLEDFSYNLAECFVEPKRFAKRLFSKSSVFSQCNPEEKQKYLNEILAAPSRQKAISTLCSALGEYQDSFQLQTSNKKFTTLFHEMGHLQDYFHDRVSAKGKFASEEMYPEALRKWLDDEEKQGIAFSISNYATSGPGEFIAETYSKFLTGEEVPKAARELYIQMQGPKIPDIV